MSKKDLVAKNKKGRILTTEREPSKKIQVAIPHFKLDDEKFNNREQKGKKGEIANGKVGANPKKSFMMSPTT